MKVGSRREEEVALDARGELRQPVAGVAAAQEEQGRGRRASGILARHVWPWAASCCFCLATNLAIIGAVSSMKWKVPVLNRPSEVRLGSHARQASSCCCLLHGKVSDAAAGREHQRQRDREAR